MLDKAHMQLHGKNFIGPDLSAAGAVKIYGYAPREGSPLPEAFSEATKEEIDRAFALAIEAFEVLRSTPSEEIAVFLEAIAGEIEALGDALIERASLESGLPKERLTGERGRTVGQLRLFASLVRDGSYLDARIDTALPDRKPLPRPDLRRLLIPVGPVAVFGASNFPLAFSVAGGDTASAFAARNPVIVKAHPAHPGTCELVASAIRLAVLKTGLPAGTFSMIHAADPAVSILLVTNPATKAVAFTGSQRAGRAIFDAASRRPDPIPAYVEMGSSNPVFLLPGALAVSTEPIAQGLFGSINLGVGQFCTSPGVIAGLDDTAFSRLQEKLAALFSSGSPGTMLHPSILKGYSQNVENRATTLAPVRSSVAADVSKTEASPVLFEASGDKWLQNPELVSEIFGPSAVVVKARNKEELLAIARGWHGTLTASLFGTPEDLIEYRELVAILEQKAGRVLFNGFPTGVEVSPAMHHGGPYPATADPKFTSVGTAAIFRFLRPICYQNFPQPSLPAELRDENPRGIWRLVNGSLTKDAITK